MENPKIEWITRAGRDCLKFTFQGKFTREDALAAQEKWRQELSRSSRQNVTFIWDCLSMDDYDHEARTLWQETCKEMKDKIDSIWVITNSILIKMGASVISVFTSLKIKVVSSESEIQL